MGEKERFEILKNEIVDKNVYYYLKELFENLNIEILGDYEGSLFDLMQKGKLEGWCWQTTETAALFMPDDTIIYRGNLHFNDYNTYYHSFIEFNYNEEKYIFDPCFCMINTFDLYFNTFNVDVKGKVSAKKVKEYFINYVNNSKKEYDCSKSGTSSFVDNFLKSLVGEEKIEEVKKEVVVHDKEDPSAPMYRNGSGYKNINIDNNKIKSLTVHYYLFG